VLLLHASGFVKSLGLPVYESAALPATSFGVNAARDGTIAIID
jgi:hypothetical protein